MPGDGSQFYTKMAENMISNRTIEHVGFERAGNFNKAFKQFQEIKLVPIN